MKKLAVLAAVVVMAALAAPAFSMTNPFMDVPMNHWAYDAIGQLAANGILSGFPDGTYKGQQQTTRYEMASALARSLAVVDMTKASKQDVEMLKRLVVEFKDELEALGVRVDELDERVAVLENRLGGWHIQGTLVLDVMNESRNSVQEAWGAEGKGSVGFDEARIIFERTWGENDEYHFFARLRNEGTNGNASKGSDSAYMDRFYVDMPFFMDTQLRIGRWNWAWEGDYKIGLKEVGGWNGDQILTDWTWTGMGITKNFGIGTFQMAAAHPDKTAVREWDYTKAKPEDPHDMHDWMLLARGTFQFTENFGFDLGGQLFVGDNAEEYSGGLDASGNKMHAAGDYSFNNLWTIYGGLRFNFTDAIALKGIFYYQKANAEQVNSTATAWQDVGYGFTNRNDTKYVDNSNHWAAIIDIKQEALKFTSLWLEYGQFKEGFTAANSGFLFYSGLLQEDFAFKQPMAWADTKYWRVGADQEWNDKWTTYLFYYGYDVDMGNQSYKPAEFGLGVSYKLNDYTTFGLNYMHAKNDMEGDYSRNDNVVRFRTKVAF